MPRPISLALSTRSTSRRDEADSIVSVSLTRTPTMKKAKARLSRLLHRKSFESQEYTEMYECRDASKKKTKSLHRQTMFPTSNNSRPIGGGTQDIRWNNLQQTMEHGPHKLSMVSERDEPLTPLSHRLPRPASRSKRVLEGQSASTSADLSNRPPLDLYGYRPEYRPESAKSSIITKTIASTSKHDSMLTDYSELCAMPSDFEDDELREIHELPSSTSRTRPTYHGRTPSYSAPILATEEEQEESQYQEEEDRTFPSSSASASSHYSETSSTSDKQQQEDIEETPVSPIAPRPTTTIAAAIPQVTALDVQNMPDFSFVPNAVSRKSNKHLSATGHVAAAFPDCGGDNVAVTDWQVECYRLRKQLKAIELQLRYCTELLTSEQTKSSTLEQDLSRTKTDLRLCRGEIQLLRVSNGLKHDETCALKAELGSLRGGKLKAMAERLALEEDAVADKDLRIKWLEKEREELERENRVLENVKGALWGHMEQARIGKRDTVVTTPLSSPGGGADGNQQPSWWI